MAKARKVPRLPISRGSEAIPKYEYAVRREVSRYSRLLSPHIRKNSEEDLTQEGRLGVMLAARAHKPEMGGLSTIVFPSIKWRVADAVERLQREPAYTDTVDITSGTGMSGTNEVDSEDDEPVHAAILRCEPDQDEHVYMGELTAAIHRFLSRLQPHERAIVYAIYWRGKTQAEVARQQGVTQPLIHRILRDIQQRGRDELAAFKT